MTEREIIEEMAQVLETAKIKALATIGSLNNGFGEWYAKALYEAGYRRVDENEIVVNKDQWQDLLDCDEALAKQFMRNCVLELALKKARKETAREILALIDSCHKPIKEALVDDGLYNAGRVVEIICSKIKNMIAETYGVEVEE